MSTYGVELTSSEGKKFVIPDYNPFTFYAKFSIYCDSLTPKSVSTGVSADIPCMFFLHGETYAGGVGIRQSYMEIIDGVWHLTGTRTSYPAAVTWTVYVFSNRLLKDETQGNYGIQVFDGEGNMVLSNNTKPLKLEYYDPVWTPVAGSDTPWHDPIFVSSKRAALVSIHSRYNPRNNNKTYFCCSCGLTEHFYGESHFITSYGYTHSSKFGAQGTVTRSYYQRVLAIDCSLYD